MLLCHALCSVIVYRLGDGIYINFSRRHCYVPTNAHVVKLVNVPTVRPESTPETRHVCDSLVSTVDLIVNYLLTRNVVDDLTQLDLRKNLVPSLDPHSSASVGIA